MKIITTVEKALEVVESINKTFESVNANGEITITFTVSKEELEKLLDPAKLTEGGLGTA